MSVEATIERALLRLGALTRSGAVSHPFDGSARPNG